MYVYAFFFRSIAFYLLSFFAAIGNWLSIFFFWFVFLYFVLVPAMKDKQDGQLINCITFIGHSKDNYLYRFTFVMIQNQNISDAYRIIVITGGGRSAISSQDNNVRNTLIFNYDQYDRKQLISVLNDSDTSQEVKKTILPLNCEFRAATRLHKNRIHCIYDETHFMIWLDQL